MLVQVATKIDIPCWLDLAGEVEHLFGPMVDEPEFHDALEKTIDGGNAFCIREDEGPPGTPLMGGMLFSAKPPVYKIGWLAVARKWRRHGVARVLMQHVLGTVRPPAEVRVTTFVEGTAGGEPARALYKSFGLEPEEMVEGPFGQPAQVFRLRLT